MMAHFLEGMRKLDLAASPSMRGVLTGMDVDRSARKTIAPGDDIMPYLADLRLPGKHTQRAFWRFCADLYGAPAKAHGFSRWGMVEASGTKFTADMLRLVFPKAKFLFVVRHPLDCLGAIKASRVQPRDRWGESVAPGRRLDWFAANWAAQAAEFGRIDYGLKLRYEDLLEGKVSLAELNDFLEIALAAEAVEALRSRPELERGRRDLKPDAIARLLPVLRDTMLHWGYE